MGRQLPDVLYRALVVREPAHSLVKKQLRCELMAVWNKRRWLGVGVLLLLISAAQGSGDPGSIAREMLAAHNRLRARMRIPPLSWSRSLASSAQEWASLLIARGAYAPRRDGKFGQNLFEITGGRATPRDVVTAWASEASNYQYRNNSCSARCGHYTQVIWRDTKQLGCGVAGDARRQVWVCDYDPPGNVIGERPY